LWLCEAPVAHLFEGWQRLRDVAALAVLAAIGGIVYGGIIVALFGPRWLEALRAR
jgi:putative peptidoglycan lipid II flippase